MTKPKWIRDDGRHLLELDTRLAEVYHDDEGWTLEAWDSVRLSNRCGYIDGFRRLRDAKVAGEVWVLGKPL